MNETIVEVEGVVMVGVLIDQGLIDDLAKRFMSRGNAHVESLPSPQAVQRWRAAARAAAKRLGRPVTTLTMGDCGAWAGLSDWPSSAAEEEIANESLRRAAAGTSRWAGAAITR